MFRWFKSLFCKHEWNYCDTVRTEVNTQDIRRCNICVCTKCGAIKRDYYQ